MKARDLAFIVCRVIAVSCVISIIRSLPTFGVMFIPVDIRPPLGVILLTILSSAALLAIAIFLWIDTEFFASLFTRRVDTDTPSAISGSELKRIAYSCLGLLVIVETIGSAPQAMINFGLERFQNIPGSGIRFLFELMTSLLKFIFGVWLFLGTEKVNKIKHFLVRD